MSGSSDTGSALTRDDASGAVVPGPLLPAHVADAVLTNLGVLDPGESEATALVQGLLSALDASLVHNAPGLLVDELLGQADRLAQVSPGRGLGALVSVLSATLARSLPAAQWSRVSRLLAVAVGQLRDVTGTGGTEPDPRLSPLAREFLRLTLAGQRRDALRLVVAEVELGATADELLVHVVEPTLLEAERRLRAGQIEVGQERHCTVVTEQVMAMLYAPRLDARPERPRAVTVALAADCPRTRIRVRIVSDLLERRGWRVAAAPLGAAEPVVVDLVAEQPTDVLAVAAALPHHVDEVQRIVAAVRADDRCGPVRVVVGGPPFARAPGLAGQVGADGTAAEARGYVVRCEELLARAWADGLPGFPRQRRGPEPPHPRP